MNYDNVTRRIKGTDEDPWVARYCGSGVAAARSVKYAAFACLS